MRLVTVATESLGYYPWLQKSCARHGILLDVLGWGCIWQGFTWRYYLMKEYLAKLPDDEIVCFIDSFDVLMLRPLEELETKYIESGHKIIVSSEKIYNPFVKFSQRFIFGTCRGKLLNAGVYMGRVSYLLHMITCILSKKSCKPNKDDQVLMTKFCKQYDIIHIDTACEFFLTIPLGNFLKPEIKIQDGNLYYKDTKRPFVAHGAGNSDMNDIIQLLGYPMTKEELTLIKKYSSKSFFKKTLYFSKLCFSC